MRTALRLALVGTVIAAYGCSGSESSPQQPNTDPTPEPETSVTSQIPPPEESTLRKVVSCDDLSGAIKNDAVSKLNLSIDAQIDAIKRWSEGQFGGVAVGSFGGAGASNGSAESSSDSSSAPSSSAPAAAYSETNTQVKGVDEADIVKNDGQYIYVLHGSSFQIVNAWPAPSLAASTKIDVEGQPVEMFVAKGKAVIFSTVTGESVYSAAGVTPHTRYTYATGADPCYRTGASYYCAKSPLTKVTILSVAGTNASVARELYFEGSYTSSRRVDANVRVVLEGASFGPPLQTYPNFPGRDVNAGPITPEEQIAAWEDLRQKNSAAINATTLRDWIPYTFVKNGATITADTVACDKFLVPTLATTEHGVTELASFNLDDPNVANTVAIVGTVDTVYSNADTMILAAHAWPSPKKSSERPENRKAPFVDFLPSSATYLHRFDLKTDPATPRYTGSGWVRGTVQNQFAIDERAGAIRVATTELRTVRTWISDDEKVRPFTNGYNVNHVFAVKSGPTEALKVVGDVGDLAPGERIYSTRFVGDKGYVVTFRQVDPLFVVDLAKPEEPKLLAQLKIPGFSEYMHPIDDGHLLTIGRDTEGGRQQGLAIQIFDVTNPVAPSLMHKYVFDATTYGYSEAEQNHKAFTYYADKKLLSFPFYGYSATGFRSSAELFSIDLASGITKVGSVDHTALFGQRSRGYCGGYYSPQVRRSVFMEDVLYSISYAGVIATDTKNINGAPLATAALSAPVAPAGLPYACE